MNHQQLIAAGLPAFRVISEDGSPVHCTDADAELWRKYGYEADPLCLVPEAFLAERTDMIRDRADLADQLANAKRELAKLREQKPVVVLYVENGRIEDVPDQSALAHFPDGNLSLYAAPVPAVAAPTDEQIHAAYRVALGQSIRERDMPEIRKFAIALLQSAEVKS